MKNSKIIIKINLILILLAFTTDLLGQTGNGLVLNGIDDYVEVPDTNYIDLVTSFSIEVWINPNNISGGKNIIGKQWCENQWAYNLSVVDGKLKWVWNEHGGSCSFINSYESQDVVIESNKCTHITVIHNENYVNFYIDGELIGGALINGEYSPIFNSKEPLRIGVYKLLSGELTNFFDGAIDEIRIWNYELTQNEIQNRKDTILEGNEAGLLAYYNMEDQGFGEGTIINNIASFTGDILNGVSLGTSETPYFEPFCSANSTTEIDLERKISMYPNPFINNMNFNISPYNGVNWTLQIINSHGQILKEVKDINKNEIQLDIDLPNGIYIYVITIDQEKILSDKIIKI